MAVITNKWVEKEKKKKLHETAAAYAANTLDSWIPINPGASVIKRHSKAARSIMVRTLRGTRK